MVAGLGVHICRAGVRSASADGTAGQQLPGRCRSFAYGNRGDGQKRQLSYFSASMTCHPAKVTPYAPELRTASRVFRPKCANGYCGCSPSGTPAEGMTANDPSDSRRGRLLSSAAWQHGEPAYVRCLELNGHQSERWGGRDAPVPSRHDPWSCGGGLGQAASGLPRVWVFGLAGGVRPTRPCPRPAVVVSGMRQGGPRSRTGLRCRVGGGCG